jgi:hypothetical protein
MPAWLRSFAIVTVSVGMATLLTFPLTHITVHSLSLFCMGAVIVVSRCQSFFGHRQRSDFGVDF